MGYEPTPRVVLEHPASGAQQRLWFIEQLAPGQPVHNLSAEIALDGAPDVDRLAVALADVVARHEALRTTFRMDGGQLTQIVWSALRAAPIEPVAVGGVECDTLDVAWSSRRRELAAKTFDLVAGPLLRLYPAQVGADRYALVVVAHHMVVDGISFEILLRDLFTAYQARSDGQAPDFEPLPVQYADFTAWQASRAGTPEAITDLAFWRDRLRDLPTIDLTRGRPRPTEPGHYGGEIVVPISTAQLDVLKRRSASHGATVFMALTALWAEAVGRWFGSTDVPIGVSIAGRPLGEVANVIGLFVDRVVLRMDTSGRPSFDDLVQRAREVVVAANDHTAVTFEQIVDALRPPRTLGVTPLYQVGINLVPVSTADGQFGNGTVRHDLNLDVLPSVNGMKARLQYRDGVVSESDAVGLADLFGRLLAAAVHAPERSLREVPTIVDTGRTRSIAALDGTGSNLAEMFFAQASRTPDAIALVTPVVTLTYRELAERAARLADELRARGIQAEVPVLLAAHRRAELIVAMLGILASGGAYVPVDLAAPRRHLEHVVAATGATVAVVPEDVTMTLPLGLDRIDLDRIALDRIGLDAETAVTIDAWEPPAIDPRQAAYVLFTSGTTGTPKGVVVEHRQVIGYVRAVTSLLGAPSGASFLMVQPPTFDSCVTQIYGALLSGGVLHLVDEDLARDPNGLADYSVTHHIDYLKIVPSHLSALLAGGRADALRPHRAAIVGGEGSTSEFVGLLRRGGWPVVGHYGPTETTVGVLAHWLDDRVLSGSATTPLGPPLPGVRAYVLDAAGDPVAPGTAGELHIGGALVARGYAGRGGRTADVFRPDPFGAPGERMYCTGDLVRAHPDGWYEFLGRLDRQVKVGGHRIELGAVEAILERHEDVRQAVAVVLDDRLVAYVVPAPDRHADEAMLHGYLSGELPTASLPAAIVLLSELPQKSNGKLDLAALPDPVVMRARTHEAPATATEATLGAVVAAVLGRPEVSVGDSFFDLGGDSIRAIYLVAQAGAAGLAISVRDVFRHQSVRSIAAAIDSADATARAAARDFYTDLFDRHPQDGLTGASRRTGAALPGDVSAALGGPAHAAYHTDPTDLLLAAVAGEVLRRTGSDAMSALVAIGAVAVPVGVALPRRSDGPTAAGLEPDPASLVRAAKAGIEGSRSLAPQWAAVGSEPDLAARTPRLALYLGSPPSDREGEYQISLVEGRIVANAPIDAADIAKSLSAIVRHCGDASASYSAVDFPDADLDDAQLSRLLDNLGVDRAG